MERLIAGMPVSATVLALRAELKAAKRRLADLSLGERAVEIFGGREAIWAVVRRRAGQRGGVAIRVAHCWGGYTKVRRLRRPKGALLALRIDGPIGVQVVVLRSDRASFETLRVTTVLTPSAPLLIPFLPRDLYPLGVDDDPTGAVGRVEAAQ